MTELKPGWQRVKFGEVVRQVKDKVDPATSGLTRFIAGEHMDTDDFRIRRWGEIDDGYLGPAFHMRFKPGQVLYGSRRTYLGTSEKGIHRLDPNTANERRDVFPGAWL
jgi:type I restriction enzyme S subunit